MALQFIINIDSLNLCFPPIMLTLCLIILLLEVHKVEEKRVKKDVRNEEK